MEAAPLNRSMWTANVAYPKGRLIPFQVKNFGVVVRQASLGDWKYLRFTVHSLILLCRSSSLERKEFPIKYQWMSVPTGTILLTKSPALHLLSLDNQGMVEGGLSE